MMFSRGPKLNRASSGCCKAPLNFGPQEEMYCTNNSNRAMPLDSKKTLDDLRGEGLFRVGGVKHERILVPAEKAVDVH